MEVETVSNVKSDVKEPDWKDQMATIVGWTIEDIESIFGDTEEQRRAEQEEDRLYDRYRR